MLDPSRKFYNHGTNFVPIQSVVNTILENISVFDEDEELEQSIGQRLGQCRRLLSVALGRDITQDEFAEMCGFSTGVFSHWERGHKNPSEATLERVVALMQQYGMGYVTVPWLRYGIGEGLPVIATPPAKPQLTKPFAAKKLTKVPAKKQAMRKRGK